MVSGLYEFKFIDIDADGDRTCTSADLLFEDASAPVNDPFTWRITPTSFGKVAPAQAAQVCDTIKNWPTP